MVSFRDEELRTFTEMIEIPMKRFQEVADRTGQVLNRQQRLTAILSSSTIMHSLKQANKSYSGYFVSNTSSELGSIAKGYHTINETQ